MLQSGKLRERITIECPQIARDGSGGMVAGWGVFAERVAASRRDFSGEEKPATAAAGGAVATARVEFTTHWRPGVDATMRVRHDGQYFNIRHVNNFAGRRQSLILTCDTGVNDG